MVSNVVATANTRDLGVNEMSAALKRRFNFETVFPIADIKTEIALVRDSLRMTPRALGREGAAGDDILELLVTTFRELRSGESEDGQAMERLTTAMSTAEAVSVAHAVGVRGYYSAMVRRRPISSSIVGAAVKKATTTSGRLRRHFLEARCVARGLPTGAPTTRHATGCRHECLRRRQQPRASRRGCSAPQPEACARLVRETIHEKATAGISLPGLAT